MMGLAKRFIAAAALSSAVALPGVANAQIVNNYDLGLVTAPALVPLSDVILTDGSPTTFLDLWTFDLTPDSFVESLLLTINSGPDNLLTIDPATFSSQMVDSSNTVVAGTLNFNAFTNALSWTPFQPLSAGLDYQLQVTGLLVGALGGGYSGHLAAIPIAIPEPEAYAMLLAGLGLLGFIATRRKAALRSLA